MKRQWVKFSFAGVLTFLSGCGGGPGGGNPSESGGGSSNNPPQISSLTYSPKRAFPTPTKDNATVSGSVNVFDQDGDATFVKVILDSGEEFSFPISGGGTSNTTVNISAIISLLATPGPHNFTVEAFDSRNNLSNKINGTFTVGAWMAGVRGGYVLTSSGFQLTNFESVPSFPCTPLELGVYEPILTPTTCPTVNSFDALTPTNRTVHMSRVAVGPSLCGDTPQTPTIDLAYGSSGWHFSDENYGEYVISFSSSNTFKIEEGGGYCQVP